MLYLFSVIIMMINAEKSAFQQWKVLRINEIFRVNTKALRVHLCGVYSLTCFVPNASESLKIFVDFTTRVLKSLYRVVILRSTDDS